VNNTFRRICYEQTDTQAWLDEIAGILQDEVAYVQLYTQPLIWAVKESIDLIQRPDDFFTLRWVTVN